MTPCAAPTRPGAYWAKLVNPNQVPKDEDWRSKEFEPVLVVNNYIANEDDEDLVVMVAGIAPSQSIKDFVWGAEIPTAEGYARNLAALEGLRKLKAGPGMKVGPDVTEEQRLELTIHALFGDRSEPEEIATSLEVLIVSIVLAWADGDTGKAAAIMKERIVPGVLKQLKAFARMKARAKLQGNQ
uniref:hypothetical protein n=1 Tax=Stappia sp. TaxID=1870903 RepID=UPI003BACEEAD